MVYKHEEERIVKKEYTKKELLEELKRVKRKLNNVPTVRSFKKNSKISTWQYTVYFKSWNKALEAAGFSLREEGREKRTTATKEEIIEGLSKIKENKKGFVNFKTFNAVTGISHRSVQNVFGSWGNVLKHYTKEEKRVKYTTEKLIEELQRVANDLGESPYKHEFGERSKLSIKPYLLRFGSWGNALESAGLKRTVKEFKRYTNDEILKDVKRASLDLGGMDITTRLFDDFSNTVTSSSVKKRLNLSWEKVLQKIGIRERHLKIFGKFTFVKKPGLDGNVYCSLFELAAANCMYNLGIKYEYEKSVCADRKWTCDFYIENENLWLEIDGVGKRRRPYPYNHPANEKIKYYKENNYNYKIITHKNSIRKFFNDIVKERGLHGEI